jgi:hypothetical protein
MHSTREQAIDLRRPILAVLRKRKAGAVVGEGAQRWRLEEGAN